MIRVILILFVLSSGYYYNNTQCIIQWMLKILYSLNSTWVGSLNVILGWMCATMSNAKWTHSRIALFRWLNILLYKYLQQNTKVRDVLHRIWKSGCFGFYDTLTIQCWVRKRKLGSDSLTSSPVSSLSNPTAIELLKFKLSVTLLLLLFRENGSDLSH